jgi:hypothetical protein
VGTDADARYLAGRSRGEDWWPEDEKASVWDNVGYHTIKRIDPWLARPDGSFPPSPYSANASNWYDEGRLGFGGQRGVVPNVGCWNYWNSRDYGEGVYRNFADSGPVNTQCN